MLVFLLGLPLVLLASERHPASVDVERARSPREYVRRDGASAPGLAGQSVRPDEAPVIQPVDADSRP